MKNLEIKIRLSEKIDASKLSPYYFVSISQKDTYYSVEKGRLKLREIDGERFQLIRYHRDDISSERNSEYDILEIEEIDQFKRIFDGTLKPEVCIKKTREVFLYDGPRGKARIHLDDVEGLGDFLEVEVLIDSEEDEENAQKVLQECLALVGVSSTANVIGCGYRELMLKKNSETKDLDYYRNTNKVFWYVHDDLIVDDRVVFRRDDITPCIFVEVKDGKRYILQLDEKIKFDRFQYTMWRKLIGKIYGARIDVLLIPPERKDGWICDLDGNRIEFKDLGRSSLTIDSTYLAKFAIAS